MSDDSDFLLLCAEEVDAVTDLKRSELLPLTPRCVEVADDDTPMPFGKYRGIALKQVPADYLIWWLGTKPDNYLHIKAYCIAKLKELENEARYTKDKFERDREQTTYRSRCSDRSGWGRFDDPDTEIDEDDDWGDRDDF